MLTEAAAAFDDLTRSGKDKLLTQQSKDDWPNTFRAARFIPAVEYIQANRARTLAMDLATIARAAVLEAAPAIEPPPSLPETYRRLLGIYADSESGWLIRLEWRDGKLSVIDPDDATWRPTLAPTDDPDVFLVEPGTRQSGERAVFRSLSDGRVASLFLAASTFMRLDRVAGSD